MTTHDQNTSGRRSFFARLFAGAGSLAGLAGTGWGRLPMPKADAGPTDPIRVRLHPDAVPRTPEQSTTNG